MELQPHTASWQVQESQVWVGVSVRSQQPGLSLSVALDCRPREYREGHR